MKDTLENKAKFFAQYLGQPVKIPDGSVQTLMGVSQHDGAVSENLWWFHFSNELHHTLLIKYGTLELNPLSTISDEDAFEVARIMHGDSDDFAIEFNAVGITSVSPYGRPCYGDTVNIHWNGRVSYERGTEVDTLHAYQFLQSKGYAIPYMGLTTEQLVEYGWIELKEETI